MNHFILSPLVAVATLFSTPVNAENFSVVERNIPVKKIEKIEIKGSTEVIYTQGNETKVTIKGASDLVDLIIIENNGNVLTVSQKDSNIERSLSSFFNQLKNGFSNETYPIIYVTSPDLIGVTLTGSGDFKCPNKLDTDNLEIFLKGSGDVDFTDIICDNLHALLQGSGDIDLKKVEAINTNYELKGSGDIDVKQQRVHRTDINLYGSGDVKVVCTKCQLVNAKLTGSGDIDVYGDVEKTTQEVRGSGDIEFH